MGRTVDPYIEQCIREEGQRLTDFLIQKNREYGNSVFDPMRIFSDADPVEQIKVRIDDKLSRLANRGEKTIKEDTVADLRGYLRILVVAERLKAEGRLPGAQKEERNGPAEAPTAGKPTEDG